MSSQQRVQTYLEKHRISTLFEDLMARLIKHLPNEPIPYLMKVLQRYEEKTKPSEQRPSSTMPAVKKPSGASWAGASLPGMGADRGYNRPWTENMKKNKGRGDDDEVRKSKKEPESSKKRTPTSDTDVEHLFKKGAERKSAKQWAVSQDDDSPPPPRRQGPSAAEEQETQLLQEEMSAAKLQRKYDKKEEKATKAAPSAQELTERRQKPGAKAKKHKQQLAEMAAAQLKVETLGYLDSGEEPTDPDQAGYEEAMDILEDADELASEGVTNIKRTGHKVSKSMRRRPPPPDPEVKVAMCSKCARLIGGDDASTAGGDAYGKYATLDSLSDITSGEYGGTFKSPLTTSDDDFESASQVVGPRHPVWVETENGARGQSSSGLKSTMIHDSSRELFSSTSQGAGNQSSTHRVGSSLVGQAWDTRTYHSQTEVSSRRVVHSDSLVDNGRSWQQPSSDEDSGF